MVNVENLNSPDSEPTFVLTESVLDSGYYVGILPTSSDADDIANSGVLYVQSGDEIKVTYSDLDPVIDVFASTIGVEATTFLVIPLPGGGAAVFGL